MPSKDQEANRPAEEAVSPSPADAAGQPYIPPQTGTEAAPSRYMIFRRIKAELVPGYVLRKVGQAFMIMPTGPRMKDYQGMITLNETGAFLYKQMEKNMKEEEEPTFDMLIDACMEEYGATAEEAKAAVDSFSTQCSECGLLAYEDVIVDMHTGMIITEDQIDQEYLKKEMAEKEALKKAQKNEENA